MCLKFTGGQLDRVFVRQLLLRRLRTLGQLRTQCILAGKRLRRMRNRHEQQKTGIYQVFCGQVSGRIECDAGGDIPGMLSGITICYLRIVFQVFQRVTETGNQRY